jgi:hypothetical protein
VKTLGMNMDYKDGDPEERELKYKGFGIKELNQQ